MISFRVAPPGRFSRSRTLAVLLPSRAPSAFADLAFLGALVLFFAEVGFFPDLAFEDATWARRGATRAFLGASGSLAVAVASVDSSFFASSW